MQQITAWVDLTDGEAMDLWIKIASPLEFADALIAKFKEKNTPLSVEAAIEAERNRIEKMCYKIYDDDMGDAWDCVQAIREMK